MDFLVDFFLRFSGPFPYVMVMVVLLACGLGVPIPEDLTLIAAGLLSYYGVADVHLMVVVGLLGVLVGDGTIFFIGRRVGFKIDRIGPLARLLPPDRLEKVRGMLKERGNRVIFFARFMPGLRAPIYFCAGALHLPIRVFVFFDGLAALLSVPLIVYSVFYFGDRLDHVIRVIKNVEHGILVLVVVAVAAAVIRWRLKLRARSRTQIKAEKQE